jgi:hypothetical protein
LKRTGEERVGERETEREGGGGKKEGLTNLQDRTTTAASSILPSPPKTVFFSSTTEPNAVKVVQGVAAGLSLQSQNQTRCKLYRELQ